MEWNKLDRCIPVKHWIAWVNFATLEWSYVPSCGKRPVVVALPSLRLICFAMYRLLYRLNLWKRIDKESVRCEHCNNRLFTIASNGEISIVDHSRLATVGHSTLCILIWGEIPCGGSGNHLVLLGLCIIPRVLRHDRGLVHFSMQYRSKGFCLAGEWIRDNSACGRCNRWISRVLVTFMSPRLPRRWYGKQGAVQTFSLICVNGDWRKRFYFYTS